MDYHRAIGVLLLVVLVQLTDAKLDLIKETKDNNTQCTRSSVDYNVTLANGAKAGKFYKMDKLHTIDDCLGECCGAKKCDVAFLVNKVCYLVECKNKDSCGIKQSDKHDIETLISIANKHSKVNKVSSGAEPAIDQNLAEEAQISDPFISDDDMTSVSAFGTGKYKRTKRSSDVIDLVVAVGCGTVAVCVGVAGVIMMTRRLIDNSKNSAS